MSETQTSAGTVLSEQRGAVAWITVNRPEKLNALNRATFGRIVEAVEVALADPGTRVLVITGAGEKAFVAGADIAEMSRLTPQEAQEWSRELQAGLNRIERAGKPVLAAVNGFALGGGCELAMACHVRIAADTARLGQPEVALGLIPGASGTQRLPRLVGRGRALDLILSGDPIPAVEALRIGLVERVVPAASLREEVEAYAAKLLSRSPTALSRALEAVLSGGESAQPEAERLEAALFGLCFATDDMREGTAAFLEKRKASFPGK
ncbi:MAG TPA: enoyl-CoA hydratase-related protein [Candidatus Polarisedimenticolaceae bacterium]|nr:enoyl-CoA hydratase-related protein [Candidatus Polarisedimenticolaceae bacterium]